MKDDNAPLLTADDLFTMLAAFADEKRDATTRGEKPDVFRAVERERAYTAEERAEIVAKARAWNEAYDAAHPEEITNTAPESM